MEFMEALLKMLSKAIFYLALTLFIMCVLALPNLIEEVNIMGIVLAVTLCLVSGLLISMFKK